MTRSSKQYNRIFKFIKSNASPTPTPPPPTSTPTPPPPTPSTLISAKSVASVKEYLDNNNLLSGAPFSACTFGNAFTGEEIFIGAGNAGPTGEPVNKDMYWRWASQTKLLGFLLLGAALEDGIIGSIDDFVYKYIPEFENITTYVSDSTANVPVQYDTYGTPLYTQLLTTDENLGKSITIRMLTNCSSGLGYSYWGLGSLRDSLLMNFVDNKNGQNYIAWLQNIESTVGHVDFVTNMFENNTNLPSITKLIIDRVQTYPLLCKPGSENIYDSGLTFVAGVIGAALHIKNIPQTAAQYAHSRLFVPLGMTKSWLGAGALNPPSDVLKNLTDAYFVRQDYKPAVPGELGFYGFARGPNVKNNTLYKVFDPAADGDGFKTQMVDYFTAPQTTDTLTVDYLTGGLDGGGCGPISDYCKLLKLLINKGLSDNKTRVLSPQTVEWLLASKYTPSMCETGLNGLGNGCFNLLSPSTSWCGGFSKQMDGTPLPFGYGPQTFGWLGYFHTHYFFDTLTGNYMFSGTQSSYSSWMLDGVTTSFEPDADILWRMFIKP